MTQETEIPANGAKPKQERGALRVVNVAGDLDERHDMFVSFLDDARGADPLPTILDMTEIRGTWLDGLAFTKRKGKADADVFSPASQLSNALTILMHDARWRGILAYDEFAESIVSNRMPPWHKTDSVGATVGDWTEEDTYRLESWLQRAYSIKLNDTKCMAAVSVAARANSVHPVRSYLRALEWDGIERISKWLVTLLGVEDTPYARAVGRAWLISAVARVMRPGCKADCMMVLEGKTGIRKSSALRAIATGSGTSDTVQPWFTEISSEIDTKETPQLLRRKWIVELGELAALRRTRDQETIKSFLSRQEDNYRAPYGRRARDYPRQSVFAGSTNEERYLRDPAGARRFWPVRCGNIYLRGIEIERDQLWAEAVVAFDNGEPWHLATDEVVGASVHEQGERYEEDVWCDVIREWAEPKRSVGVTVEDVLGGCLQLELGKWGHADASRVGAVLRRIGWVATGRGRPRRYKPE